MKNLKLSLIALLAMGNFSYGGGDISPITDYEIEDAVVAEEESYPVEDTYVEPIEEEPVYVAPEPVYVAPEPEPTPEPVPVVVATPQPVVVPAPVPKPPVVKKNISTNGFYAGLGITGVRYKDSCYCKTNKSIKVTNKDTTYGVVGRVGYDFNQYIGVEARGSKTQWGSDGTKVEHAGIYLKPMIPIGDKSNIYGLVGAAKTRVKGKMPHLDSESLALGAGVEVDLSKDIPKNGRYSRDFDGQGDQEKGVGLFIDYERMVAKKDAPRLDAVSAGVTYDF
jgi:OOP family OmpA-OmpF porin